MERKIRKDKKTRVNSPLEDETHKLLCRLALACGKSKTSLAAEILEIALRTPDFVLHVQDRNHADSFRVIPIVVAGRTTYMQATGE